MVNPNLVTVLGYLYVTGITEIAKIPLFDPRLSHYGASSGEFVSFPTLQNCLFGEGIRWTSRAYLHGIRLWVQRFCNTVGILNFPVFFRWQVQQGKGMKG
jgi:hypothetical protein